MSGVYMSEINWCPYCKKRTFHNTGWESEDAPLVHIKCVPCHGPTAKRGRTVTEGMLVRLVKEVDDVSVD